MNLQQIKIKLLEWAGELFVLSALFGMSLVRNICVMIRQTRVRLARQDVAVNENGHRETEMTHDLLSGIIYNLEYAAYNLCDKTDSEIEVNIIDSTCPEISLFISIRKLKEINRQLIQRRQFYDQRHQ